MKSVIVNALAVCGGIALTYTVGGYILKKHRKEIKAAVIEKAVDFLFDEEEEPQMETKQEDPIKSAVMAYLKQKGAKS